MPSQSPVLCLHTLTCVCCIICSGQVVKGAPKNKVCGLAEGTCWTAFLQDICYKQLAVEMYSPANRLLGTHGLTNLKQAVYKSPKQAGHECAELVPNLLTVHFHMAPAGRWSQGK